MPDKYDLLVLAELNPDVVVTTDGPVAFGQVEQVVDRAELTLGSSGAITACAAAAQGLHVALCAVVGDDAAGAFCVEQLAARGVDVSGVVVRENLHTGMTIVLTRDDGDRAMLTFPGTMAELGAADLAPGLLGRTRHVHVSSYYLQQGLQRDLPAIFGAALEAGATTSLDTGWDPAERWLDVVEVLDHVDVFLPNLAECQRIGGSDDWIVAARALQQRAAVVAVKLGADGAGVVTDDAAWTVHGAPVAPVDTTGAGDNFNAGYLVAMLAGDAPSDALARAAASGAVAVTGWGGTGRMASAGEARERATTYTITRHDGVIQNKIGERQ